MLQKFNSDIRAFLNNLSEKYQIDLTTIILLCLVAQHSFLIKFAGILILFLLHYKSLFNVSFKKIPLFYTLLPTIELFKFFFLDSNYSNGHIAQFIIGMVYWLSSLFLCKLLYIRIETKPVMQIGRSVKFFTLLNFAVSIAQFLQICFIEGVINPYNTGHHHPYGVSSGDLITGLLGGVHLTNVFISLILVLYYVHKRETLFMLFSLIPFLLCGSNFGSMVLLLSLGVYFLVSKERLYVFKASFIIFLILIAFYGIITPYNAHHTFAKLESIITRKPVVDEAYQQEVENNTILVYKNGKNGKGRLSKSEQETVDRLEKRKGMILYDFFSMPGKKTSYMQTKDFLKSSPQYLLFGAGLGRFSSNIAFNFSGVVDNSAMHRIFPSYQSPMFEKNHKSIYAYMKTTHVIFHSESNKPFSSYNQLLGEYGLIGFFLFCFGYIAYFLKRVDRRTHSIPIIIVLLFALNLNYFFEALNLLLFFETIMFLNIKEKLLNERV